MNIDIRMRLRDNTIKIIVGAIALSLVIFSMFSSLMDANTKNLLAKNTVITTNSTTSSITNTHQQNDELTLLREEIQSLRKQLNHSSASGGINSDEMTDVAFDDGNKSENNIMYGHVHIAKTGGTSLNGILANRFERVCGNKGYSYDAYNSNEKAKKVFNKTGVFMIISAEGENYNRDKVRDNIMKEIGYEDCDYVSREFPTSSFWIDNFAHDKFHGIQMELHVPCRDPIDHLLSQCNMRSQNLDCSSSKDVYFRAVQKCFVKMNRYENNLQESFDSIKCYDFREQFTTYIDYMGERLQERRFISEPYIKRETNEPRNKTNECLLQRPDLMNITRKFLLKFDYYKFCDSCIGSKNDITSR